MRERLRTRHLTAFGSLLGARVGAKALGAVTAILLARVLGPEGFGQLAAALAVVAFGTPLLQGAMDNAALRVLARRDPGAGRFLRSIVGAKLWVGLGLALVLPLLALPFAPPAVVAVLALNALLMSLVGVVQTWWVAREEQQRAAVAEVARALGWMAAAAAVYFAGGDVLGAVGTRACASALLMGVLLWAVARRADLRPSLTGQRLVLKDSTVFFASGLFFIVYQQADRLMLVRMAGDAAAGHYAAAATLVAVFYMMPGIFTTVFLPRMYRTAGEPERLARWLDVRLGAGLCLAILIVPLLIGLRGPLLGALYGEGYAAAAPVLLWLGGTIFLRFVAVAYGDLLTAANRQWRRTGVQAAVAGLNIGLNLVLIPRWGAAGAAAATLACELVLCLGYVVTARALGLPARSRLLVPGTLGFLAVTLGWLWQPQAGLALLALTVAAAVYAVRRGLLVSASS
ncbi:MAG: oligosaccharide flippase family protein [Planctomycetota bacterium]